MSKVSYSETAAKKTITLEGLDSVRRALGDLQKKSPAAAKVAINATAREARKVMIAAALARYAVNSKGKEKIRELAQKKRATNRSLSATLRIESKWNDLGYFDTRPRYPTHFTGRAYVLGPEVWRGRVLKESALQDLPGVEGHTGKAFLAKFQSGHIGMVQRQIGKKSDYTRTATGKPRWKSKSGVVEKLKTLGAPSGTAMHNTIWPEVEEELQAFLLERLDAQVQKVLSKAGRT